MLSELVKSCVVPVVMCSAMYAVHRAEKLSAYTNIFSLCDYQKDLELDNQLKMPWIFSLSSAALAIYGAWNSTLTAPAIFITSTALSAFSICMSYLLEPMLKNKLANCAKEKANAPDFELDSVQTPMWFKVIYGPQNDVLNYFRRQVRDNRQQQHGIA